MWRVLSEIQLFTHVEGTLRDTIIYTCGGYSQRYNYLHMWRVLLEIQSDDDVQEEKKLLENIFIRENISCKPNIEIFYYSANIFKRRCIVCGTANAPRFLLKDPMLYPQCDQCDSQSVKIAKRKAIYTMRKNTKKHSSNSFSECHPRYSFQVIHVSLLNFLFFLVFATPSVFDNSRFIYLGFRQQVK